VGLSVALLNTHIHRIHRMRITRLKHGVLGWSVSTITKLHHLVVLVVVVGGSAILQKLLLCLENLNIFMMTKS
jgi:hypothetical protein